MRRNIQKSLLAVILTILLGGCGSSNKEGSAANITKVDEATCRICHADTLDPISAKPLLLEYLNSPHNTAGVGCQDCHGGGSQHFGIGPIPFPNPDAAGVCSNATCHSNSPSATQRPSSAHFPNLTPTILASPVIWDNMTTAAYITSQDTNKCTNCHKAHDNTLLQQNFDWAASAHAATKDAPWIHFDFKALDVCNRCHTTTGYVKCITTGNTTAWAAANSSDKTKEVLRCDGCHVNYSWKRRSGLTAPNGVQLPYGTFSSVIPSPAVGVLPFGKVANNNTSTVVVDMGDADLCINCHSGTNSGKGIATAPASILTGSFAPLNSHYFGAAGNLFALDGYEYLTHESYFKPIIQPGTPTYANPNGSPGFEHYQIGVTAALTGTTRGPCVGCHMYTTNPPPFSGSHLLMPVTQTPSGSGPRGVIGGTITGFPSLGPICGTCHTAGFNPDDAPDIALGGAADINTLKAQYASRLAALETALRTPNAVHPNAIFYNPDVYPYFFDSNGIPFGTVIPWPNKGTLGAAFNLNNLTREPGGYAHNHWYAALLIYDSLDFLDDGLQNNSYTNSAIFPTGRSLSGPLY